MSTVLIAGGSGLIGTTLSRMLISKGYKVIILTRSVKPSQGSISYAKWDINKSIIDKEAVEQCDCIIHLAGAGVADERWTKKRKKEIIDSRVKSSELLVNTLKETNNKVQAVISASAIGWYGPDQKGKIFTETDPPNNDFLGETCRLWEQSIEPAKHLGKRLVILRTGIVLSNEGGAFVEFKKPMKAAIAGILGDGKQVISWIHIDDLCRMYIDAIENNNLSGVYNAVTDHVSNKELIVRTARARKKPFIPIHVPEFALKLVLGEMSIEVLKSTTVDSSKIKHTGYKYLYPTLDAALNELVR